VDIAFRVDSSIEMGVGHIMRCLALADELRKNDASITFVCRDLDGHLGGLVIQKGYMLKLLPSPLTKFTNSWLKTSCEVDSNETLDALESKIDLLIVDHYGLQQGWHRKVSRITRKIMVIDDLANRQLSCDILLDQTFGREKDDYLKWVGSDTTVLCGTNYALLREQFSKSRDQALKKRRDFNGIKNILVNFGGADFSNDSSRILNILSNLKFINTPSVDVVLGKSALYMDEIQRQVDSYDLKVRVFSYVDDIAGLMLKADVAIGAGGSSSWERCALGLPALLFVNANNQLLIAKNLEKAGAVVLIDKSTAYSKYFIDALLELDGNKDNYNCFSQSAANICDGLGVKRVVDKILGLDW
jgi:UDP-2,4-diacetamido-2,4,6-trideoxy-beta-L-altropyranose hydrolase